MLTFQSRDFKKVRKQALQVEGKEFQKEGAVNMKVLRDKQAGMHASVTETE